MKPYDNSLQYAGINNSPLAILVEDVVKVEDINGSVCFHVVGTNVMNYDCLLGRNFLPCPNLRITFGEAVSFEEINKNVSLDFMNNEGLLINDVNQNPKMNLDVQDSLTFLEQMAVHQIFQECYVTSVRRESPLIEFEAKVVLKSDQKTVSISWCSSEIELLIMFFDSDEEDIIDYCQYRRQRRVQREYWIHPLSKNVNSRLFVAAKELSQTDRKFIAFYRMSKESYLELTRMVTPLIEKMNTNMRECVPSEERVLITLRHIADRFELLWNLPNCLGALDGKHIRIEKHFHSTVLLVCCDADDLFTMIESGFAGRSSDGGIFKAFAMNYWLIHGGFDIPLPSPLRYDETSTPFPFYFVADEAFPLARNILRPYSSRNLDNVKRIFNYRFSRGRKSIECVFGMAAEMLAVLNGPIRSRDPAVVNNIIKAACVLHNFVRKREGILYTPQGEINETVKVPKQHRNTRFIDTRLFFSN
ncbi:hypothetical protein FQR65_LT14373 [Abscondita terminalis]|nr:hypothetical protein FQR65_LT14373 [Abscondita terminalis]